MEKRRWITIVLSMMVTVMVAFFIAPFECEARTLTQAENMSRVNYRILNEDEINILRVFFDYDFYKENNSDVVDDYGDSYEALFNHFVTKGVFEGRDCCSYFNPSAYGALNPDLLLAFGANPVKYYEHYLIFSDGENREDATLEVCATRNVTVVSLADSSIIITPVVYFAAKLFGTESFYEVAEVVYGKRIEVTSVETPRPTPSPAPAPIPNPAPIPVPAPNPNPTPGPGPSPEPTPTPDPGPTPGPGPSPGPTPTPDPAPTPSGPIVVQMEPGDRVYYYILHSENDQSVYGAYQGIGDRRDLTLLWTSSDEYSVSGDYEPTSEHAPETCSNFVVTVVYDFPSQASNEEKIQYIAGYKPGENIKINVDRSDDVTVVDLPTMPIGTDAVASVHDGTYHNVGDSFAVDASTEFSINDDGNVCVETVLSNSENSDQFVSVELEVK